MNTIFDSHESFQYFLNKCSPEALRDVLKNATPVWEYQNKPYFLHLVMTVLYIKDQQSIDILTNVGHINTINVVLLKFNLVPENILELYLQGVIFQDTIQKLFKNSIKNKDILKCIKLVKTNLVQKEYQFNQLILDYLESCKNKLRNMGEWMIHINQKAEFMINLFLRGLINCDYLTINTSEAYIVALVKGYQRVATLTLTLRSILHKQKRMTHTKIETVVQKRKMLKELKALPESAVFPGGVDYLRAKERFAKMYNTIP